MIGARRENDKIFGNNRGKSMIRSGQTIAGKRERPESDSERKRAKKYYQKKKLISVSIVIFLAGILVWMAILAGEEFIKVISRQGGVEVIEVSPTIEVIDETTGVTAKMSARMREFIANLETELGERGLTVTQARIPVGKIREVDLSLAEFSGVFKVSLDRGIGVTAEDIERMIKYLKEKGIEMVEYVDVRVERKAYWR